MTARSLLIATLLWAGTTVAAPRIDSVAPASPARSNSPQTITVTGDDFQAGLKLEVTAPGGEKQVLQGDAIQSRRPTTFQASLVFGAIGRYELVVTNPNGEPSPPYVVEVKGKQSADAPVIARVTPAEVAKRAEPQALQVEGSRFNSGLKAIVTDPAGADVIDAIVSKLTPNSFELMVKLDQAGDYSISVVNPSGTTSNVFTVLVR
jgi:hypothetical protein